MAGQAASSAGGAAKYLAGLKQSAESFFLSTLIVQAGFAGFVIIAHLALNWKLKKKLGKVPAALAFPKFEVVILMAFFESVCQTCLVTIAAMMHRLKQQQKRKQYEKQRNTRLKLSSLSSLGERVASSEVRDL